MKGKVVKFLIILLCIVICVIIIIIAAHVFVITEAKRLSRMYYNNPLVNEMVERINKFIDEKSEERQVRGNAYFSNGAIDSKVSDKYYIYDFAICMYGFCNQVIDYYPKSGYHSPLLGCTSPSRCAVSFEKYGFYDEKNKIKLLALLYAVKKIVLEYIASRERSSKFYIVKLDVKSAPVIGAKYVGGYTVMCIPSSVTLKHL